jgi:aldehyde dehydrogenase (NAD+)
MSEMRAYFESGVTRPAAFRKEQLRKLKAAIVLRESALLSALHEDLGKSPEEAYVTEIGQVLHEISYALRHLDSWMKPERIATPLAYFPSRSTILKEPLGIVLIIAPWNYPLMLLLSPLVGAIAAGNCMVCKPSEHAPATSAALASLLGDTFPSSFIQVLEGDGAEVIPALLALERPDHILFTGSIPVGREILKLAAPGLVPVTLELGGKSPAIVDGTADLGVTARRIVQGKFINAGQTCVAPDYLLVHASLRERLIEALRAAIVDFFGENPAASPDYGRIINAGRFRKLKGFLSAGRIIQGGQTDEQALYIAPTLLDEVPADSPIMQEEIFGPLLPIMTFEDREELSTMIGRHPQPLALYVFSEDRRWVEELVRSISFGGGCINNTLVHFGNPALPVGGIGYSGMGRYHGRESFRTFSHLKSVTRSGTWIDPKVKYPPYKGKMKIFRFFFR